MMLPNNVPTSDPGQPNTPDVAPGHPNDHAREDARLAAAFPGSPSTALRLDPERQRDSRPPAQSLIAQFLLVQVVRRVLVSPTTLTLSLARPGTMLPPGPFHPGQYITLLLPGQHDVYYRTYSLSGPSDSRAPWEITVRHLQNGVISTYLFEQIQVGMVFQVAPPRGDCVLPPTTSVESKLVFIAGGSGITPFCSMIRTLALLPASRRPQVALHHAGRTTEDLVVPVDWQELDSGSDWLKRWHYLADAGDHLDAATIIGRSGVSPRHHWYISGAEAFVAALYRDLLARDLPPEQVSIERRT